MQKQSINKQQVATEAQFEATGSTEVNSSGSMELTGLVPGAPEGDGTETELTGLEPGAEFDPFRARDIKGFNEGAIYRNVIYRRNKTTKRKMTAIFYPAPPGNGNRQPEIRKMKNNEVIGPVISVQEIRSGGKVHVTLEVPFYTDRLTTAFINATTNNWDWLAEVKPGQCARYSNPKNPPAQPIQLSTRPAVLDGRSPNTDIRERVITGQEPESHTQASEGEPEIEPEREYGDTNAHRFKMRNVSHDDLQLHLSQQVYDDQIELNERRQIVLNKIQEKEGAEDVEYKDLHRALHAGVPLETMTGDELIDAQTEHAFQESTARKEIFKTLRECKSESFDATQANKLNNMIQAIMCHPMHPMHHFRNDTSLLAAINTAATITGTFRSLEQKIINTKEGTNAESDATERPEENGDHWKWIRDFKVRQVDLEIIDIHKRVNESSYKHNFDSLHDAYVQAVKANDRETMRTFTTDVQDMITDSLTVLQHWGSLHLLWLYPFAESIPR